MKDPLGLADFKIPIGKLAPLQSFSTRAGPTLSYRLYPSWSDNLIFLYHGVGSDSRYLCVLAAQWAQENLGTVVTPDLRGHGASYGADDHLRPGQLEEDYEELLIHLRMERAFERIFIAGHSLGGGFALRLLSSTLAENFSGGVLLAPYLPSSFRVHRPDYGEWIRLDEAHQVHVNMPEIFRTGHEKLSYSPEYMRAASPPENFGTHLNPHIEVLLLSGDRDQVFLPERYREVLAPYKNLKVEVVEKANHFSLVIAIPLVQKVTESLKNNFNFFA